MDPATRALLNSIAVAVLASGLAFMAAWFWHRKNLAIKMAEKLALEHSQLMARVSDMELQLSAVKQTVLPISAAFQAILIKELTHFHTPRMDELMTKIGPPNELTAEELQELAGLLEERAVDMDGRINDSERDAAIMLPMVIKRVQNEQEADDPVKLKIVTTPVKTEASESL